MSGTSSLGALKNSCISAKREGNISLLQTCILKDEEQLILIQVDLYSATLIQKKFFLAPFSIISILFNNIPLLNETVYISLVLCSILYKSS